MSKKVGQQINVRATSSYNNETKQTDNPNSRSVRTETITKVFSHGVKTKESGYVNNARVMK
jgi:hypothetical protein